MSDVERERLYAELSSRSQAGQDTLPIVSFIKMEIWKQEGESDRLTWIHFGSREKSTILKHKSIDQYDDN